MAAVDAVTRRYNLAGEVLVARGGHVLLDRGYGTIRPDGGAAHRSGERWRLASITKQVTAALIVRDFAVQRRSLDETLDGFEVAEASGLTMRQLLTHHSGLANPDDSEKDAAGVPAAYRRSGWGPDFCASKPPQPSAPFAYNNCDYLVAGKVAGWNEIIPDSHSQPFMFPGRDVRGLRLAGFQEKGVPGFVHGKPEPAFDLDSFGEAGGLIGKARAVFDFDRSLMTGRLVPPAALAELWKPEGNGSYQALGQWVFPGRLKGCAAAKRIVQRDGEIYGVQARNFILPEDDLVVVFFTNRSADDFPIGEVWQGRGFAYDLLSAAVAC